MIPELRGWVSKKLALHRFPSSNGSRPTLSLVLRRSLCSSSSIHDDGEGGRRQPRRGEQVASSLHCIDPDNAFAGPTTTAERKGTTYGTCRQNPPDPIPNRPLRGEKPVYQSGKGFSLGDRGFDRSTAAVEKSKLDGLGLRGKRTGRPFPSTSSSSDIDDKEEENLNKQNSQYSRPQPSTSLGEKQGHNFLEKFKLGFDKGDRHPLESATSPLSQHQEEEKLTAAGKLPLPQDADEIFKKMKETGLIPNAVAMLDGLCKDGLVQEAMKLFSVMREKGTIPEVVIYTAVVEGFCKAQKFDDAKRIFRKMQNNGVSPNAFSYTVLIQGLCKGKQLEDALYFCLEMLEAGHSPNLATFVGLVDGFCQEKGLEEARSTIVTLRQKGFSVDEKLVREYLEKKGPFLPLVWEAIFGKKSPHRSL